MNSVRSSVILISLLWSPLLLRAPGLDTSKIDQALGRSGPKIGGVYKVGFARTDLHVSVHGLAIRPGLALGSCAAFTGMDDNAMVMGDLVLLQDKLNPVMEKLRSANVEISAVHNHLIDETPRIVYAHYMGHATASQLATALRAALAVSKTPLERPAIAAEEPTPPAWVKTVEDSIGRKGTFYGGVLSYGLPRPGSVTLGGITIAPAAGVAEAINFQAADSGNLASTGDFVLTADEVNPVISALEAHHISVTALHSYVLTEEPRLFFMHFWADGPAQSVAEGMMAALEIIHTK